MTKFQSLVLALAAGQQAAAMAIKPSTLRERQLPAGLSIASLAGYSGIMPLLNPGPGGIGKFMGEPEATEALTSLARLLGATKTSAGHLYEITKSQMQGYGTVKVPKSSIERRVTEKSRTDVPGAKTVKVRYGPYLVPSAKTKNSLGQMGMLANYPHINIEKPCQGDCTLMGTSAGLEYLDGTNANIDTGMWLHHMVVFNVGPGREDPPCAGRDVSVPHVMMNATSRSSERIFASGNERTYAVLPPWGVKDAGYKINSADTFSMLVELMNENPEDKTVWITMTYDIVDGHPFKDDIKTIWFDVRQCGTSEVNPPKGQDKFVLDYSWTSTIEGELLATVEHLHDGGASMSISADGEVICDSQSAYGTKPEYVQPNKTTPAVPGEGHSHGGVGMKHISEQPVCHGPTLKNKVIKKGTKYDLKAYYDFSQFKGQQHEGGEWDEVMGIAMLFVRVKGKN